MQKSGLSERLAVYRATQRKGVDFLLNHVNEDGSIGEASCDLCYYRVPWAFTVAGEQASAMRLLEWIRRHMLTAEGEMAGRISPNNDWYRSVNTYTESCLAYGAYLLRQYDIAQRVMQFDFRWQNPDTGGVYMDRERTGADGPQLLMLTAQLGMSALLTGHMAEARRAGEWLVHLWQAQPELPQRLYTVWTEKGGLATAVPAGENKRNYINESQETYEYHYNGGIAAACLAYLYMATGEKLWLDVAKQYQAFSMESTERQFETKQVCKSSWGSSLLSIVTGDQRYLDWTVRMGDWFTEQQTSDGHWFNTPYHVPSPTLNDNIQITAEFVVHMDHICTALGAALARVATISRGAPTPPLLSLPWQASTCGQCTAGERSRRARWPSVRSGAVSCQEREDNRTCSRFESSPGSSRLKP